MDPKELKKLQEKLKKDQGALNAALEILKKGQVVLVADQGQLEKDLETLATHRDNLANELELLADDRKELKDDRAILEAEKERLGPLSVIEPVKEIEVNPKWLKDQVFRGKKENKPIQKPGKKFKTRVFEPFERPMAVADVLSFRVDGNEVVLVTADGQKLKVKK